MLGAAELSAKTLGITALRVKALGILGFFVNLSINYPRDYQTLSFH